MQVVVSYSNRERLDKVLDIAGDGQLAGVCGESGVNACIRFAVNAAVAKDRSELAAPAESSGTNWQTGCLRICSNAIEEREDAGLDDTDAVVEEERAKVAGGFHASETFVRK